MGDTALAIVGSRAFDAPEEYAGYILDLNTRCDTLVSGGARGVDAAAEAEARRRGLRVISFRPVRKGRSYVIDRYEDGELFDTWQEEEGWMFPTFGEAAKRRNWLIAEMARGNLHACWDGMSGGTAHAIAAGLRLGGSRPPRIWMAGDS